MPNVEEPMDPIDPLPQDLSSSRKRPSWLRGTLDDAEGHVAPRGTFWESKKSTKYQGYLTIMSTIIQNEPSSFTEAVKHQIKHAVDGSTEKYTACFVARGFSTKEGIDCDKTFAPVARYTTIRLIISLAASQGWNLHQMDIKTTFLHGSIKEEVYVEQPEGFEIHDGESHMCRLKKALMG
eukprot:PITA_27290